VLGDLGGVELAIEGHLLGGEFVEPRGGLKGRPGCRYVQSNLAGILAQQV
jgi:hypothetical protein